MKIFRHHVSLIACGVLLCAMTARAVPLAEYQERVRLAVEDLDDLSDALTTDEDESAAQGRSEIDAAARLREVREHLPQSERVEWAGGALAVDNSWLHWSLDQYEKLPGASNTEKVIALSQMAERLRALDDRLAEATSAPVATRDKETEKGRLEAILRRAEFNKEAARGGALRRLWERFVKWLESLSPESKPLQPGTARGVSTVGRYFVYALGLAVVAVVLWFYGPRVFRRNVSHKKQRGEARVVLGEQLAPEQTGADLLAEAERLAHNGDWRGAVRKAYIAVLCELGDRQIIRLAQHKTNRDYLRAIARERATLHSDMQPLTTNYERLWYGLASADETDWTDFRARCKHALGSA